MKRINLFEVLYTVNMKVLSANKLQKLQVMIR